MVMIFKSDKARNFLLENGAVFTYRVHRRKKVGNDWITDEYRKPKIADAFIKEEGQFTPYGLWIFVEFSGFSSLKEWVEEIKKLNKGKIPAKGWLYKVILRPKKLYSVTEPCSAERER